MRRRGDRDRQSTMHRDAALKPHELHRNLTLVVVHGDHAIVAIVRANGAHKRSVCWERAVGLMALRRRQSHARRNHAPLFITVVAVVAIVRVQTAHCQAWVRLARLLQCAMNHADGLRHLGRCQ